MKEAGNEIAHAALIRRTEMGFTGVIMAMNMKYCRRIAVGDLEDFAESRAANTGANVGVWQVVLIRYGVPRLSEQKKVTFDESGGTTTQEPNPFGRKRMRPREVRVNDFEEGARQSQTCIHRKSLACSAKIRIHG